MYLQSFVIQGFKSFPEKTALSFEAGLTAVVGPNGSGKSNIAEAMRWVLGEQNPRALRCEKRMEELIFHGAKHRGPMGFAEVSLRIDNRDGLFAAQPPELEITRRLYRSGESEYFVNRASVRLKDVLELFMDTGLGRDGYSIIGQGKIGEILSEKSGDRRRVFEEAAGISRFRYRREEAERKLTAAETNFLRIGDKIEELQLQMKPLQRQAEVARTFLTLQEELKALEINVWLDALEKIQAGFAQVRTDLGLINTELQTAQESLETLYRQSEGSDLALVECNREAERLRGTLSEKEAEAAEIENAISVIRTSMQHNEESILRLGQEQKLQESRSLSLSEQIDTHRQKRDELLLQQTETAVTLEKILRQAEEAAAQSGDAARQLDALRAMETQHTDLAHRLRMEHSSRQATLSELMRADSDGAAEWAEKQRLEDEARAACQESEEKVRALSDEMKAQDNILEGFRLRLGAKEKRCARAQERGNRAEMELNTLGARLHMLSEMEREHEGHAKSVVRVMHEQARGGLSGLHGTVSDLLTVDDRCAVAIETALGAALQNIVTQTEQDAKAAISFLRRSDAGRATFLPLSVITGRTLTEEGMSREAGFVGLASELVRFEESYRGIFENLLGRTVVVETLDHAIALARRRNHRFRIVTLDGQVVAPGGAMIGGSVGRNVGLLTRKNEIARLSEEKEQLTEERQRLTEELATAKRELAADNYEFEVATGQRRALENALLEERARAENLRLRLSEMLSARDRQDEKRAESRARRLELEHDLETLKRKIDEEDGYATDCARRMETLLSRQQDVLQKSRAISDDLAAQRALQTSLETQIASEDAVLRDYEAMRAELTGDEAQKRAMISDYERKNRELSESLSVKEESAVACKSAVAELKTKLSDCFAKRNQLEEKRVVLDRKTKELHETTVGLERERARLEARQAAGEAEERGIMDRLWEQYGLSHSAACALRTPMESAAVANRRIAELKAGISALGQPNLGAIEEFERISERYDYLSTQHDDAAQAREQLLSIIEDITGEMQQLFSDRFAEIGRHFSETFEDIFGGGTARLELTDPENVLTSDVEIRAQPPGKKLRSISLLSGGEKSLVAIALYFSIFKVRPAPFCVLDEVDHDLDERNVARFSNYLRRLSKDKQFVVITHRRGTMETAGVLYGVTTQEEGVSKILKMKLDEVAYAT